MQKVKIALTRFYNAKFVDLEETEKIVWEQNINDLKVVCQLSKYTTYSRWGSMVMHIEPKDGSEGKTRPVEYPEPEKLAVDLFFEVMAYKWIDIDNALAESLVNEDLKARDKIFKDFDKYEDEMKSGIDYAAGMLGLRVNPELVTIPIFEVDHQYLFINDRVYSVQCGLPLEVRATVHVDHKEGYRIVMDNNKLKLQGETRFEEASECLGWFLRGWATEDYVLRFISFFTALESTMPMYSRSRSMPIMKRFKKMAKEANLEESQKDISDFKKYKDIRNALLHEGDSSIAKSPFVKNDDLRGLEYLSQKYVGFMLYGRRKPKPLNEIGKAIIYACGNFKFDKEEYEEYMKS